MKKVLDSKFAVGSVPIQALLNTGDKTLGEAGLDQEYGTGLPITRWNTLDKQSWKGKDLLGKMLMDIRNALV